MKKIIAYLFLTLGLFAQKTENNFAVKTNLFVMSENVTNAFFTPAMTGAVGNGSTDDTIAVNKAIAGRGTVLLPDSDRYLITSLTNTYGSEFTGIGKILTPVTYGSLTSQRQLNSYGDDKQLVFGREYLSHAHKRLIAGSAVKIVFSGDSTTAGDGTTTPYRIWELVPQFATRRGLSLVTGENRGQSGKTAAEWVSTYLAGDLALSPNVLIVRWGINDPFFGRTASQTIDSIRTGLATIRATYGVDDMTVVLMMPNSTNDEPNNRDPRYYEDLVRGLRAAARDYQCVFLDTYAMFRDSFNAADWMDNPYSDGRHIHPLNVMNTWVSTLLSEVLFPSGLVAQIGLNQNVNVSGAEATKASTDSITTYPYGLSQYRATSSAWPLDGVVVTFKGADGTALQFNYAYDGVFNSGSMRFWKTGSINAWTDWRTFGDVNFSGSAATPASTLSGSLYPYGASLYRATGSSWPFDGQVYTSRHVDGSAYQIVWPFNGTNTFGLSQFRIWRTGGGLANTWSEWVTLGQINISGSDVQVSSTSLPSTYPQGESLYRAVTGFPVNGQVWTARHIDGSAFQFNWGYQAADGKAPWFRYYYTDGGGGWNAWQTLVMQDLTGKASVSNLVATNIYAGGITADRNASLKNYQRYVYKGSGYASGSTVDLFSVGSYGLVSSGTLMVRVASGGGSSRGIHVYTLAVSGGGEAATISPTSYQQYGGSTHLGTLTIVKDTPSGGTDTVRFTVGATALSYLEWWWTPFFTDSGTVFTEL